MTTEQIPASMRAECTLCRQIVHRHALLPHDLSSRWSGFRRSYCERCREKLDVLVDCLLADNPDRCELARRLSIALEQVTT